MTDSKRRVFWDSCVFVRLLSKTSDPEKLAEQEICRQCLQAAIDGKIEIVISTASIAEVVKTEDLVEPPVPEDVREKIRSLFNEPYCLKCQVEMTIEEGK